MSTIQDLEQELLSSPILGHESIHDILSSYTWEEIRKDIESYFVFGDEKVNNLLREYYSSPSNKYALELYNYLGENYQYTDNILQAFNSLCDSVKNDTVHYQNIDSHLEDIYNQFSNTIGPPQEVVKQFPTKYSKFMLGFFNSLKTKELDITAKQLLVEASYARMCNMMKFD